ncbi:solute carrier family 22 member 3-like isoform X2 [Eriocheir sinensis]|uniref:solute carrier family 22 member 3-like isoform X2 n=1 Tax=Eriocheir sinensis TaxID=95602 RepID=UPI0021C70900|nr:solute carrier family 22 member 3-like isoform X2 [Eriocheir sinensis]
MESISSRHRTAVGILMGAPYSLLVILLAIVGHFLREWSFLHLVSGIVTYLILPLSFVVEESPRWLAQSGQGHKAAQQLLRAADNDKVALPPHLVATLDKVQVFPEKDAPGEVVNQGSTTNFLRQFRDFPSSFCVLLTTAALWFFLALMYFSVMLNSSYFSSTSAEMYVGLSGGLEAVAVLVVMPVTQRLGRRLVMGVGPILCGSLLVANLFVPEDLVWLRWLVVMGAMFLICAAYQVQVVWWGSGMVMGVTGAVIALIVYFLPETNNTTLPDTLQDLENLRNRKKPPVTPPPPPPHSV